MSLWIGGSGEGAAIGIVGTFSRLSVYTVLPHSRKQAVVLSLRLPSLYITGQLFSSGLRHFVTAMGKVTGPKAFPASLQITQP